MEINERQHNSSLTTTRQISPNLISAVELDFHA
jgi:hypothetical protein